jgi:hypothetical protein
MKATLPPGVPPPLVTCAVKVTDCPYTDGFALLVNNVVVVAGVTVWLSAVDVWPVKLLSPPYTAVMLLLPRGTFAVVSEALPLLSFPDPSGVLPSMNVTVPLGVPAPGKTAATVAVRVTGAPS